jgi:hypothetical protein
MYKYFKRRRRLFAVALLTSCITGGLFVSCKKGQPTWDVNVLTPIVSTSLSINNLLADTLIKVNPDTSVSLIYNGTLYDLNTDSILKMPDTILKYPYVAFFTTTVNPGQPVLPVNNSTTTYNINTVQLRKATLLTGFVDIEVTSYINQPTDMTYKVACATLGGSPLIMYVKVPAKNGTIPGRAKRTYSLANYSIDFTGPSHNGYNTINTILSGIVDSLAPSYASISPGDSLNINARFYGIEPNYAKGYFGTVTKTYTSQSTFPLFKKVIGGSLMMQNISVTMQLENNFGIDARINLAKLSSVNTHTASTVNLTDAGLINNSININRATETFNPASPVIPSVQTFSLTPANSNILAWLDNMPNNVGYTLQVTTDPLGNVSGSNDFAYYGYGITSNLNISLPLSIIANNLTLEDTLNANFANSAQAQQVKSGTFTIYADNGFPFSAGMQVYLLDSNMKIADSLMAPPQTIAAGIMNSNGIVLSPQNSVLTINMNTIRTQLLLKTKHIIVLSRFNMGSNPPPVYRKIYSYYQLNVKLVGNFDYQIKG